VTCIGGGRVGCPGGVVVWVIEVRPGCSFGRAGSPGMSPRADAVSLVAGSARRAMSRVACSRVGQDDRGGGAGSLAGAADQDGVRRWPGVLATGLTKSVSAEMRPRWAAGCLVLAGPAAVAEAWRQPGRGSGCRRVSAECRVVLNSAAWLITQRSQVQILPPLPGKCRSEARLLETAVGPFGCLSAVRPWDLALGRGMLRGGSAKIGIASGCQCPFFEHCLSGLGPGLPPGTLLVWPTAEGWTAGGEASLGVAGPVGWHQRPYRCTGQPVPGPSP
jgi:hypothetical protein